MRINNISALHFRRFPRNGLWCTTGWLSDSRLWWALFLAFRWHLLRVWRLSARACNMKERNHDDNCTESKKKVQTSFQNKRDREIRNEFEKNPAWEFNTTASRSVHVDSMQNFLWFFPHFSPFLNRKFNSLLKNFFDAVMKGVKNYRKER